MSVGNRVFLKKDESAKIFLDEIKQYPTANIGDCMSRLNTLPSDIKLMSSPSNNIFAGIALTVKCISGDNLLIHQALNMAKKGDVIIASNEGGRDRSLMGEIMITHANVICKSEALILDSPIRDSDAVEKMDYPVYATGTNPAGPYKEGPGEINVPIAIGRTVINPGDVIVGDQDGVVVIAKDEIEEVLNKVREYFKKDHGKLQETIDGTINREWVSKNLEDKNVEIINKYYGG